MTLTTLQLSDPKRLVAYRDHGAGETLILIHGVGMQSAAWGPQIESLKESHRVIALDMPGHGGSDPLPQGSPLPDFVSWCRDVVRCLDLGPVNIAGHSMGALIAAGVAASYPEITRRVAVLNSVYRRDAAAKAAVVSRAEVIQTGKVDLETPLARWFDDTQSGPCAQVAAWLNDVDQAGYATAYAAFARGDSTYADSLSRITCPFLAITGDGDPNSTPAMSQALAKQVKGGQAIVVKGHRHMVNLTAPEIVNEHLTTWLKQPVRTKELQ